MDTQLKQLAQTVSYLAVLTALGAFCNVLLLKRLQDTEARVGRLGAEVVGHRGMLGFLRQRLIPDVESDTVDAEPEPQDEQPV